VLSSSLFSTVYKAKHVLLHRAVALKVLHPSPESDSNALARLKLEADALIQLCHPNIVKMYDFVVSDSGCAYLVMDYLNGVTVGEITRDGSPVSWHTAASICVQIAHALAHVHKHGILHRNIQPDNIVLTGEGRTVVNLIDFGLAKFAGSDAGAKLTPTGDLLGDPRYMSPEQCLGRALDARSDIYSLGCLLYKALIGKPPFEGASPAEIVSKQVQDNPVAVSSICPAAIPCALSDLTMKAIEKAPLNRIQSAQEFAEQLEKILSSNDPGEFVKREIATTGGAAHKRRHAAVCLLFAALIMSACALLSFWFVTSTKAGRIKVLQWRIAYLDASASSADPRLIAPLTELFDLYAGAGQLVDADGIFKQVLPLTKLQYGAHSLPVLQLLLREAHIFTAMHRLKDADEIYDQSEFCIGGGDCLAGLPPGDARRYLLQVKEGLLVRKRIFLVPRLMSMIGKTYEDEGNLSAAQKIYEEAVKLDQVARDNGDYDLNTVTDVMHLGKCLAARGHLSEARHCYERALNGAINEPMARAMNTDSSAIEQIVPILVDACLKLGDFKRAQQVSANYVGFCQEKYGGKSAEVEQALAAKAEVQKKCRTLARSLSR
jgi:tetratricopeptide (TPR) repeat protein